MTHARRLFPTLLAGAGLFLVALPGHADAFTATVFATGSSLGTIDNINPTQPDSITLVGNSVWVEYGNGADSSAILGTGGSSTIVQYSDTGAFEKSYTFAGSVDGLRYNAATNTIWALQNQDGNSGLILLDPTTGASTTYTYAVTSPDRGYDDVQFLNGQAYLSYTNPGTDPNDTTNAVIVKATLNSATNTVTTTPVLLATQAGNITDPDSLDLTAGGGLLLTGEGDGTLTTLNNPGPGQTVSTVALMNAAGQHLYNGDDADFAPAGTAGLLVADTADNTIYELHGPFQTDATYGSVGNTDPNGSGGTVDLIDLSTGLATPITTGLLPTDASPHGLAFLPAAAVPEPSAFALLGLGLLPLALIARRRTR